MSVATPISLEIYLQNRTEPECEYIAGELFPKAMGSKPHSRLQKKLILLLDRFEREGLGQVCPEQSMQLRSDKVLIPDVCVLQPDDDATNLVLRPPVLCIEILSPSDRFAFTVQKCRDYLDWGVPACWIFDPTASRAWVSDSRGLHEVTTGLLEAGPITLAMSEVFPA